jgi:diguanylate cyclase (GGDEF)-like protein
MRAAGQGVCDNYCRQRRWKLLKVFARSEKEGSLSYLLSHLPKQERDKLVDMLLACLADSQLSIALYDEHDQLRFANTSFRTSFAIHCDSYPTWAEIVRNCHSQRKGLVIATDDIEAWIADISTRRRHSSTRAFECDLYDGRWLRMTETVSDGWMLCVASDITALKTHEQILQQSCDSAMLAAQIDELTGVHNRRFLFSRIGEALIQARVSNTPLSVVMLDLDHFKQINDTYGHLAGDRVLQHFATLAQKNLRPSDLLGRIGGEEFLLMLPATSVSSAAQVVDRLRDALSEAVTLPEWPTVRCTFSAGLTEATCSDDVTSLFQRVDEGLYAAKQSGRNRQTIISR